MQQSRTRLEGAFYSEQAFFEAWRRGSRSPAPGGSATDGPHPESANSKWELTPRVDDISASIGVLSSGEAMLLAAMVSLYNSDPSGQMLRDLGATGLSDISAGSGRTPPQRDRRSTQSPTPAGNSDSTDLLGCLAVAVRGSGRQPQSYLSGLSTSKRGSSTSTAICTSARHQPGH
jgi:hypothetical protein